MNARDLEAALLTRCTAAAREPADQAKDQREANVFQIASAAVRSEFPREAASLMRASEDYFAVHPDEKLSAGEVVRRGWIFNMPRLREMLGHRLHGH